MTALPPPPPPRRRTEKTEHPDSWGWWGWGVAAGLLLALAIEAVQKGLSL